MKNTILTFILVLISHWVFANVGCSRLEEESDLILKGKVIETKPFSSATGYDRIAIIKVKELLKGSWNDSTIEVPYCSPGLQSCVTYYLNEELISFLKISPSIETVFGNHGKINLKGRLKDSLTIFLKIYFNLESKIEKVNLILDFISIGPDYSFLSSDLLQMEQEFTKEQQNRILQIVQNSDSVLAFSRFNLSEEINERQPYRVLDYYDLLLTLEDSELKNDALIFLAERLNTEKSNFIARRTIEIICQLTRKGRNCNRILKDFDAQFQNQLSDRTDSINENSQSLIGQLIEEIKN